MLRDLILQADDLQRSPIEVPEWGCVVYAGKFDGHAGAYMRKLLADKPDDADAAILVAALRDEHGNAVFSEADRGALMGKSAAVVGRVVREVLRLNGMLPDAVDEAKKD